MLKEQRNEKITFSGMSFDSSVVSKSGPAGSNKPKTKPVDGYLHLISAQKTIEDLQGEARTLRQHAEHLRLSFEKEIANEREAYLAQIAGLEQ